LSAALKQLEQRNGYLEGKPKRVEQHNIIALKQVMVREQQVAKR
jgi:hypothetical protein